MNNGLHLRVGRFAQPLFMYFENLRAEQAYPWAHLPTEGYFSVSSAITFTGADALYRLLLGDWNLNVQAYTDDARRQLGANLTLGIGVSSLSQADVSRLFFGQTDQLPDGGDAEPLDVSGSSRTSPCSRCRRNRRSRSRRTGRV